MSEPTFNVDQAAKMLGVKSDELLALIAANDMSMIESGVAHFDDDGAFVIDGGVGDGSDEQS